MEADKKLVVIAGPTAVGKTACAIRLASHYNTDIINADSRQLFRGLDIGTAKPSKNELEEVRHHFIDYLDIEEEYTAGKFEKDVDNLLLKLFRQKDIIILSGGTGFYIDAVLKGLDKMPKVGQSIRKELMKEYVEHGLQNLLNELERRDEVTFKSIDRSNPHRVVRALEVIRFTDKPYSSFKSSKHKEHSFKIVKIALDLPREELYTRINRRVDQMIDRGLLKEVTKYKNYQSNQALQTVGYKELFEYLDGNLSLKEAIDLIKRNSRRYAKRQITWLKRDDEYHWLAPSSTEEILKFVESC